MKPVIKLIKISFCGPGDVLKEIEIGKAVVDDWNHANGEARGYWLKSQYWKTDSHPSAGDRPQGIINDQMLDGSDVVVAIFWRRFGSQTGIAASGTAEEIERSTKLGKKVMVYFSDLESINVADPKQTEAVGSFRRALRSKSLCSSFSSRAQFRQDFTRHLAQALNELYPAPTVLVSSPSVTQSISGNGNIQAGGNVNVFHQPPVIKPEIARREGTVTSEEAVVIHQWIKELVESTTDYSQSEAYSNWWHFFKTTFRVEKYEELQSSRMPEAKKWFKTQRAIQKRGLKTKLPKVWNRERVTAIKAAMGQMKVENETYYPEISRRLRINPTFTSLKDLTKANLERVYNLVIADAGKTK